MQRRTLLKLGLVSGAVLALAGGAAMLLQPGLVQGRLSDAGRGLFISAGRAILQGTLPQDAGAQQQALQGMADRVDALAQNLPPHVQAELSQLVGLLCTSAGRRGLAGLSSDWLDADPAQCWLHSRTCAFRAWRCASRPTRRCTRLWAVPIFLTKPPGRPWVTQALWISERLRSLLPVPALHAKTPLLRVANARHSTCDGCALRLDQGCFDATFGHEQKTLSLCPPNQCEPIRSSHLLNQTP